MKKKIHKEIITQYDVYVVFNRPETKLISADDQKGWNYFDMLRYDHCFYNPYCDGVLIKPVRKGYRKEFTHARWDSFSLKAKHAGTVRNIDKDQWITFSHDVVERNFLGDNSIQKVYSDFGKLSAYSMNELATYDGREIVYVEKLKNAEFENVEELMEFLSIIVH
jgi:hypothetical protein